jgi:hypothetical protein
MASSALLIDDAFYLTGSAMFQCMGYHGTMKVRLLIFSFSKC